MKIHDNLNSYTQIENGKIIQSGSLNEHNDKLIYNWIFELSRANDVAKFIDLLKKNNFEFSIKNEQTFLLKLTSEKHKNELLNLIIQDNISFSIVSTFDSISSICSLNK